MEKKSHNIGYPVLFIAVVIVLGVLAGYLISDKSPIPQLKELTFGEDSDIPENILNARAKLSFLVEQVANNVGSARARLELADAYMTLGEMEKAAGVYKEAAKIDPGNREALSGLGRAYEQMGDFESAIELYKRMVREDPSNMEAFFGLGSAYKNADKVEEGLKEIEKIRQETSAKGTADSEKTAAPAEVRGVESGDEYIPFYAGLGMHDKDLEDIEESGTDESEIDYAEDSQAEDTDSGNKTTKPKKKYGEKDGEPNEGFDDAPPAADVVTPPEDDSDDSGLKDIIKKLKEKKSKAAGHAYEGSVHEQAERYQDAINEYSEALKFDSAFVDAYLGLGRCYMALGKNDEALQAFQKVVSIDPNNHDAYIRIGMLYQQAGVKEAAADAYQKALAIEPDDGELQFQLGSLYADIGKSNDALNALYSAYEYNFTSKDEFMPALATIEASLAQSGSAGAYISLADMYLKFEEFKKASDALSKAVELDSGNAVAFYKLGIALIKQGDIEGAQAAYNQLKELDAQLAESLKNAIDAAKGSGGTNPDESDVVGPAKGGGGGLNSSDDSPSPVLVPGANTPTEPAKVE